MAVFGTIFAGQFFDDLCDYYQDYESVQETIAQIFHTADVSFQKDREMGPGGELFMKKSVKKRYLA